MFTKETKNIVHCADARSLDFLSDGSIDLVVTSPPYPMIQMWDELFNALNSGVMNKIQDGEGTRAFHLMHQELDKVWLESHRVLKEGGFLCINIGDATRTIDGSFQLYANHARMVHYCAQIGFAVLPAILWHKPTNAPNKFMGSGMLPGGGYATLEHEYILIMRKGKKRKFVSETEKRNRHASAFFWEERNVWFSDIWQIKGRRQEMNQANTRHRNAAFPFELAYRLINMYSVKGDTVLDPFMGTGTSLFAAITAGRQCIGMEIDAPLRDSIYSQLSTMKELSNSFMVDRLGRHREYAAQYEKNKKPMKYYNTHYHFPVMTRQEREIVLNPIREIRVRGEWIHVQYGE